MIIVPLTWDHCMHRYSSLRVNLPREIMSFSDFPFIPDAMGGRSKDPRRYPHHTDVSLALLSC